MSKREVKLSATPQLVATSGLPSPDPHAYHIEMCVFECSFDRSYAKVFLKSSHKTEELSHKTN